MGDDPQELQRLLTRLEKWARGRRFDARSPSALTSQRFVATKEAEDLEAAARVVEAALRRAEQEPRDA